MANDLSFEDWCAELDRIAKADGVENSYTESCGPESFRDVFDDGMSPQDAWDEEVYAAQACGCF